jgi:hypothetical protein
MENLEEAIIHYNNYKKDPDHSKSVSQKLSGLTRASKKVHYYRQTNLMFKCYCTPGRDFKTKAILLEHLEDIDKSAVVNQHWTTYGGQWNKPRW